MRDDCFKRRFVIPGRVPARALTSDGLTPERIKRTNTCPDAGVGIGISIDFKTSLAVPNTEYPMAFMSVLLSA